MLVVILIFLQDWRAMLVPATTVPVTIIGAFAGMAALGFTVNLSTLFAIVLAIGIVVDDAIVVVEGAAHNIEKGMPGTTPAIEAMNALFGPIIGITLVLMSVFLPAAFLPGLTGQMYAQFALVIAATALLSAINAATLKPTQCALWLRPPVRPSGATSSIAVQRGLRRASSAGMPGDRRHGAHSGADDVRRRDPDRRHRLRPVAGADRLPADRGSGLPDRRRAIARRRLARAHQSVLDQVSEIAGKTPGVDQVITIAGVSALDNSATLANAGVAYIMLKDWSERGKGEDLLSLFKTLNATLATIEEARHPGDPAAADPGHRQRRRLYHADPAARRQLRPGQAAERSPTRSSKTPRRSQPCSGCWRSFRSTVPQYEVEVDRVKAQTLQVTIDQVFSTLAGYIGSSYVDQFNKFGRVPGLRAGRLAVPPAAGDIKNMLPVRNKDGDMIPLGTLVKITPTIGPSLISLYNLYPSATDHRPAGGRVLVRRGDEADGGDRREARCRPARASNGPPCPTRRSSSATRCTRVRAGAAAGLSRARRPIRELVRADLGHPRGAAVASRPGRRAVGA